MANKAEKLTLAIEKLANANPAAFKEVVDALEGRKTAALADLITADEFGAMRFCQGSMNQLDTLLKDFKRPMKQPIEEQ